MVVYPLTEQPVSAEELGPVVVGGELRLQQNLRGLLACPGGGGGGVGGDQARQRHARQCRRAALHAAGAGGAAVGRAESCASLEARKRARRLPVTRSPASYMRL